jgi:hypothetical protein
LICKLFQHYAGDEFVGGYHLLWRCFVGDQVVALGHNPGVFAAWATFVNGQDGNYFCARRSAVLDYISRALWVWRDCKKEKKIYG